LCPSLDDFVARWQKTLEVRRARKDMSVARKDLSYFIERLSRWFDNKIFLLQKEPTLVFAWPRVQALAQSVSQGEKVGGISSPGVASAGRHGQSGMDSCIHGWVCEAGGRVVAGGVWSILLPGIAQKL
jgi:hypothetical protein